VTWTAGGRFDLDPDATLVLRLEELDEGGAPIESGSRRLAGDVDPDAGSFVITLDATETGTFRVKIVKDGDAETVAYTASFTN